MPDFRQIISLLEKVRVQFNRDGTSYMHSDNDHDVHFTAKWEGDLKPDDLETTSKASSSPLPFFTTFTTTSTTVPTTRNPTTLISQDH